MQEMLLVQMLVWELCWMIEGMLNLFYVAD